VTTIDDLAIPQAGTYVIFAKAWFSATGPFTVVTCQLVAQGADDQGVTYANGQETMALNATHVFSAPGDAKLQCSTEGAPP
jgi:hypothetical protein